MQKIKENLFRALMLFSLFVFCGLTANAQQKTISGKITEASTGEPIIGANIQVKETADGTVSDADGNFKLTVSEAGKTIVVSYLGFNTQELPIDKTSFTIKLKENTSNLDEVVVIGYGSEKKKNVAGAVSNINGDELTKASVENFQKALEGKAAGVNITSASGTPGGAVNILIRGRGSLNASTSPLFIIDGVQVTTGQQGSGILNSTDALAGLRMEDIASIDILKDGASASIYGAQAANGVIFITTKKGAAGKTKVSLKSSFGFQNIARRVPTLNGPQLAEWNLLLYKNQYGENNANYLNLLADYQGRGWGDNGYSNAPTYDWFNAVFHTGNTQDYLLSLSGGDEKTTFFTSVGYTGNDGIMKYTWFKRTSARLNLTHKIYKWLDFSTSNNFSSVSQRQESRIRSVNPSRGALMIFPTNPIYDEDGNYIPTLADGETVQNVAQELDLNPYLGTTNKWTSSNDLTFKILPGLTFKSSFGIDYMEMREHMFYDPRTRIGQTNNNGEVDVSNNRTTQIQTDQVLNYQNLFGADHRVNAMLGVSYVKAEYTGDYAAGQNISSPDIPMLGATAIPLPPSESYSEWKTTSIFARLGYIFKDKYIFSATVRRDGSSRFGPNNRYGTFPSVSGAWRMSGENFMKRLTFIDDLKLKASYGVTGNSNIGDFVARRLYTGQGAYDGKPAFYPTSVGNENLTWEESHSVNAGLSAQLFKNRINIDIDVYNKDTKNLLYYRPIPTTTGYSTMPVNVGGLRNKGLEVLINTENIKSGKFLWTSSLNFSFAKNEITSLIDNQEVVGSYKVGESVTASQVFHYAGVNPSDGRPMFYDKDGYITYTPRPEDRIWTCGTDPKFFGGFSNTLSLGGFELSFTFQFQQGARAKWDDKASLDYYDGTMNMYSYIYDNYWKNPGDLTGIAKPVLGPNYPGSAIPMNTNSVLGTGDSDWLYEKTDYIKLKTVSLNYSFPHSWIKRLYMANLQLYAQAYNLWTTTTYPGNDPEFVGVDEGTYPQSRSFNFGIKIDF